MPGLTFAVVGARAEHYTASPSITCDLEVTETTGTRIHALALRCQVRIEPHLRHYDHGEEERLGDLFGDPSRWGETLKPIQYANLSLLVTGFSDRTTVALDLPCTYDTEVAWAKYFDALGDGEIPLLFLFSGTVFYATEGGYQVEQVPWDREATYRLPVATWREVMSAHFPGTAWLRLPKPTVDALQRYRTRRMLPTWEETFDALLKEAGQETSGADE